MRPERVGQRRGKGLVIIHRCIARGYAKPNRIADDPAQGDDIGTVIAHELRLGDRICLNLDLAQHGLGSASHGPGVLEQYRLQPAPRAFRLGFGTGVASEA